MRFEYKYYGLVEYADAVHMMQEKITEAVQQKTAFLMAMQHSLVYTSGLAFKTEDLINKDLQVQPARRGGSVTLHNPGQLMFYTVMPIGEVAGGLDALIRIIEASIIETLWQYQVNGFLVPPHSGVFSEQGKIAFVGLGLKKNAVYHGTSINLCNNLADYQAIHSCGLTLPISRLVDLNTYYKKRDNEDLVEHFAERLAAMFTERFTRRDPGLFRRNVLINQVRYPDPLLAFKHGQLYFNERRYWEAHEAWEMFWHSYSTGQFRLFLQGMIQLAMALYKLTEKPNPAGALSLLTKADAKLKNNQYVERYLANAAEFREYFIELATSVKQNQQINPAESRRLLFRPFLLKGRFDTIDTEGTL